MVIAAAVLVIGDYKQCLVPSRAVSQSAVDVVNELLPFGDVVGRVLAVPRRPPAGLKERIRG